MHRYTIRLVSAALSLVVTAAVLHGIGLVADTQSAATQVARAKAPIAVAAATIAASAR